ncbi:hypothetical protein YC2023_108862 [Brassica napus]
MESRETQDDPSAQIVPAMQRSWVAVGKELEEVRELEEGRKLEVEKDIQHENETYSVVESRDVDKLGKSTSNEEVGGEKDESWTHAAEKTSRSPWNSPKELKFGQVKITPSRYAALSSLEESREEVKMHETVKEYEGRGGSGGEEVVDIEKPKVAGSEGGRQILPRNSKTYHRVLSEL